ncbi:MAG: flagellar protein FlaG [Brevundimonas sp.]|uniref:flagellar protein FlaG n=1 Tax=Brevundimonas sp. TaxID=1871086 RepID=UPI002718B787|nr:flagellar protein FlaG [Brevundimonas sp.]MDZ4318265.1 flagellar protein FlaG [Phenylobacterium sp.]MDO9588601.1 flagellar protein FlaG [Brevundimonas sp.]MDP3369829.1 flagellar protein FlaG [Brevundimonas sp.]MDP3656369.1 flagellar protein FlaG [Brevundimonas sp.]MDZ4113361.1 flagellar protein FlaG [Brevundimonas sp.]
MNADATIRAVRVAIAEASPQSGAGDDANPRAAADAERLARYRLVIEQGPRAGSFVYKTLDRETGEVVRQLPSEEVVRLKQQGDYDPGKVIDTTV